MSKPLTLTRVQRLDSIPLDSTYFTTEGYLIDAPIVTSVGIFEYSDKGGIRRELRLPEHVFAEESLDTYEGKPVIITHNAGRVDRHNVDDEHVGTILSKGYRDGDDVRAKVVIHNTDEVKRSGLRELSLGYDLDLDETPGVWNGQPYDAIQTNIRINHLALVKEARAGDQARINMDSGNQKKGGKSMPTNKKSKAMSSGELQTAIANYKARRQRRLDEGEAEELENTDVIPPGEGEELEVTEVPADRVQIIKDRRDRRDQEGDPDTPEGALGIIAQQDEDISELIEIIEELQAKADFDNACRDSDEPENEDEDEDEGGGGITLEINTDSVDAQIRERMKLGRLGDRLNLDGLEDMRPINAKKAIIRAVNPDMRLDGKSTAYINAAFDVAVDQLDTRKDTNYQRRQMTSRADSGSREQTGKTGAERARERMIERQKNGGNE